MRKILFLATLLGFLSSPLIAQTFFPVTHMAGTVAIAGQNVTVSAINPPNLGPTYFCGAGPYYPGQRPFSGLPAQNGFRYQFSSGITHVRITMTDIHTKDTVLFTLNGVPFVVNTASLSAFAGTCAAPNTAIPTSTGTLTSTTVNGTGAGAVIILQMPPGPITDVRVEQTSGSSDGVCYSFEFAKDSCTQKLSILSNDPCANRTLVLTATNFPGASYSWFGPQSFGPLPNANVATRTPITQLQTGWYGTTVKWGTCTFKDSVYVDVNTKPTPQLPIVQINAGVNPTCKNMDLTIESVSTGGTGINYYWYGPGIWPPLVGSTGVLPFTNIQPSQGGFYYTYAVGITTGCVSDTTPYLVQLLPDVTAGMTVTWTYGCDEDTVIIKNQSTGNNKSYIYFSPVHNNVTQTTLIDSTTNPIYTVYKPHDLRDTLPDTIDVKVKVGNGVCEDSVTQRVIFNHPVRADFDVSDDTVCQRTLITFNNKSSAATGPTHKYLWDFRNGDTAQTYSVQYTYQWAGVYKALLKVTDYLGCSDSVEKLIFVDSTGAIFYNVSDSVVCAGDVIKFVGDYSRIGNIGTKWEFDDGNFRDNVSEISYSFDNAGLYDVKFTSFNRVCPDTFTIREMTVFPYPLLDLGPDTFLCPNGKPITLTDLVPNNPLAKYTWHVPTKDTSRTFIVRHPGVYAVSVEVDGCITTDSVTVGKNCYINIPNSFTPGATTNNYFMPRQLLSSGVKKFNLIIYNRWGQKVFETSVADGRGWDGNFNNEPQPVGVYVYQLNVTFENNVSENYTGNLTLIR